MKRRRFTAEVSTTGRATFDFEWEGDEDPTCADAWALLMSEGHDADQLEWSYEDVTGVSEDETLEEDEEEDEDVEDEEVEEYDG